MAVNKVFINLPVQNLEKTIAFFKSLGFTFNAQFTDEKAACMIINEDAYVMLLMRDFFKGFTKKDIADATKTTEMLLAVSVDNRDAVDAMCSKAFENGAAPVLDAQDHGFMYQRSFQDLDGHQWEIFWMDPTAVQPQ
jgi:predicted lactoylglutathione lyase